jgi:hypothetical protein
VVGDIDGADISVLFLKHELTEYMQK